MTQFDTAGPIAEAWFAESFFRNTPDMLCVMDGAGRFRRVNAAWQRGLGYAAATLEGCSAGDFLHPDQPLALLLAALRESGGAGVHRGYFRHRDGRWRWLEWTGAPDGAQKFIHATVRDITDAHHEGIHRADIEARSGIGSWSLDTVTGRLSWSPVTHAIHGTDPAHHDPEIETALTFYPPEAAARMREAIEGLRRHGQSYRLELPFTTLQGAARWVRTTAVAELRGGELARVHGTIEDITERRAERARLEMLGAVATHTTNLVLLIDPQLRITWVNAAFEAVTGFAAADVIGRRPDDVLASPASDPEAVARIDAAMLAGEPVRVELCNATRSGAPCWVDIDVQPTRDDSGALTGYVVIQTEVTERRRLQAELQAEHDRIAATLAAVPDLVVEFDAQGRYTGYHSCGRHDFLVHPRDWAGCAIETALPAQAAAVLRMAMAETDRSGRAAGHELSLDAPEGPRWFEISMAHRPATEKGGHDGYIFAARDVTDRRAARRRLELNEALFKSLFDLSPIGIVLWDFDTGDYLAVNAAHLRTLGLAPGDRVNANIFEIARAQGWDAQLQARIQHMLRHGRSGPAEIKMPHDDGAMTTLTVRNTLVADPDGRRRVWAFVEDITERKAQEAERERLAMAASSAQLRLENAVEALPDGMAVFDDETRLVTANGAYRRLYPALAPAMDPGTPLEEILRHGARGGAIPEARGREEDWIAEQLAAFHATERIREFEHADGTWLRALDIDTSDGGRVAVRIDITERRRHYAALESANDELTRSLAARDLAEEHLARVIEGAQVGTWEWTLATRENVINDRWAGMLGYTVAELAPLTIDVWRELMHPDDLASVDSVLGPVLAGAEDDFEYELRLRHKAGHWVWVQSRGRVVRRARDGAPEVMAGVHLDITDRKQLEVTVQRERDYLARLMETSISGITALDAEGRIIFANAEAEGILGLSPSELMGQRFDDPDWKIEAIGGGAFPEQELPFLRATRSGQPVRDIRHAITWPDGRWRALSVNAAPITQPGMQARVVCSITDITERLETEAKLREAAERAEAASHAKSEFLAKMSHEIRTPLNGVLGMAELLRDSLSRADQRRMIDTIRDSGETLLTVLNDVLDMSKTESGKLALETTCFDPAELAERAKALHELQCSEKGLACRIHIDAPARRVGDPHRLMQIVHNLVGNAIKFTERGAVALSIESRRAEPLRIEVSDSGIGMSREQISRIFDDFEQADGSMTRRYGGTGLGMSIVRRLIEMMGGSIDIESTEGAGTTVRVAIPLPDAADEDAEAQPPAGDENGRDLSGLQVLVADDNATNRTILRALLTGAGAAATLVENGRDAVDAGAAGGFDLLLLDISMPEIDGITALRSIRAEAETAGRTPPPAIAISANALTHQVQTYHEAGFDAHVAKPFARDDLIRVITRVTGRRAMRR